MGETALNVSLGNGITSKTFAAEVTGRRGQPLKGVEVFVSLTGDMHLDADHVDQLARATDGLGRISIVLLRPPEATGPIEGQLRVLCPNDEGSIQMRFVSMTAENRNHN